MGTPVAAHLGSLSVGLTPVTLTNAATTALVAGTSYQITTAANRRLDPATAVVVEVDADGAGAGGYAVAAADTYVVDYLFGKVTFSPTVAVGALVRVSGKSIPVVAFANVREASVSKTNDIVELRVMGNGYKTRRALLRDINIDATLLDMSEDDLDAGAGVVTLKSYLDGGAPLLLEVGRGAGEALRAWVKLAEEGAKLTPGELAESTFKFQGHAFQGEGQTEWVAWGYGTP